MSLATAKRVRAVLWVALKWLLWGLRWLAVGVFAVMFAAGVVVSLPWKVLVCLAVVPLVGTFAPKRAQPWCWAAMIAIPIWAAVWVHLPQQDSGHWRTYRFDRTFARLLQDRRIDGAPNAATVYRQVLDAYDEDIFLPSRFGDEAIWQTLADPWGTDDFPVLAEWLSRFHEGFLLLQKAAAIDQCRFPVASDMHSVRSQLRRLNQLKGWRQLLTRSANSDLQDGRLDAALDKTLTLLGIARHLYQQQTLFDQATAFALEVSAARLLRRYILEYAADAEQMERISAAMERLEPNWPDAWDQIVEHEKLIAKNTAALLYEINEHGQTRIHRSAIPSIGQGLGYPIPAGLGQDRVGRTATLVLWLSIPFTPRGAERLIDRRFEKISEQAQRGRPAPVIALQDAWQLGLNPISAIDWLARQQMSYYAALDGQYQRHIAQKRVTAIAVELRRFYLQHGRWPEHLKMLAGELPPETFIDPVSGTAFAYGLDGDDFYLYSLGRDGIDDGGRFDPRQGLDDVVFWPLDPDDLPELESG